MPEKRSQQKRPSDRDRGLPASAGEAVRVFLRHPSPLLLIAGASFFIAVRIWLGGWSLYDLIVPAVLVVAWPVLEWLIHTMVLHFRPVRIGRRTVDLKVAAIHRRHHRDPWHLPIVFIPLHIFPLSALLVFPTAFLLLPAGLAAGFLATYLLLSLHYEWCHYLAHIDWCPPIAYYQRRVRSHRLHHFHHERLWWGVSTGWGDKLLRTTPDVKTVTRSPSSHDLMGYDAPDGKWWRHDDAMVK